MTIGDLHDIISLVCPIHGINSDGVIWFDAQASSVEMTAAQQLMVQHLSEITST